MYKRSSLILLLPILALLVLTPQVSCAQPPPQPWPPEEKWHPVSLNEVTPDCRIVRIYGGDRYLEPGQPFVLYYGWYFLPTNEAYRLDTGEPVTAQPSLQDRTDSANCIFTVTIDGQEVKPTGNIRLTCEWFRFLNVEPSGVSYTAVAPTSVNHICYIEFPTGLSSGIYVVELYGEPSGGEPFHATTILHVGV